MGIAILNCKLVISANCGRPQPRPRRNPIVNSQTAINFSRFMDYLMSPSYVTNTLLSRSHTSDVLHVAVLENLEIF